MQVTEKLQRFENFLFESIRRWKNQVKILIPKITFLNLSTFYPLVFWLSHFLKKVQVSTLLYLIWSTMIC